MSNKEVPTTPAGDATVGLTSATPSTELHSSQHWQQLAVVIYPSQRGAIFADLYLTEQAASASDDADSALGSVEDDSTASGTTSILAYRTIHGRTFHSEKGDTQYWYEWR